MADQPRLGTDGVATGGELILPSHLPRDKPLNFVEFAEQFRGLKPGVKILLPNVPGVFEQYYKYRMLDAQTQNRLRIEDARFLRQLQGQLIREVGGSDDYGIGRLEKLYRIWESLNKRIEAIANSDMSNEDKRLHIHNIRNSRLYQEIVAFLVGQGVAALSQVNQQYGIGQSDAPLPFADPAESLLPVGPGAGVGRADGPPRPALPAPAPTTAAPPTGQPQPTTMPLGPFRLRLQQTQSPGADPWATPGPPRQALPGAAPGPAGQLVPAGASTGRLPVVPQVGAAARPRLQPAAPAPAQAAGGAAIEEYRYNPATGEVARRDPVTGRIEIVGRIRR